MARNHRDLLQNWGQVHFRAANKGTTICHEKCTYRQHIDECQHVHMWAFKVLERIDPWDLGMSAFLHGISTLQKVLNSFSFSSHFEALQLLQFITHSSLPFAVGAAFWWDLSLLPITFNPQFSQDCSGEGYNYPFLQTYFSASIWSISQRR